MVDLDFAAESVRFEPYSVSPLMLFGLRLTNKSPSLHVQNVSLQCQIRIEPTRRGYSGEEHDRLLDLFGEPDRWGQTLQSFLWTHASVSTPCFEKEIQVDLPVPCSYDFNIAATKYFYGLESGEAPLLLLFSGTVFYRTEDGGLQIGQIPWTKDVAYRLPAETWRGMMDHYYPGSAWLRLERSVFELLYAYKRRNGLSTWEHAVRALLESQSAGSLQ